MTQHNKSQPKIAIVHDWLNTKHGGAERVLLELAKIYPEAPIFTLLYNEQKFGKLIEPGRIHSSKLQNYPQFLRNRSRYLLPLIPKAIEAFDLSEFDVVISNSSAFVKNVITKPSTIHICYCNSPMRFAWDYWPSYINDQNVGSVRKAFISKQISKIRLWDYYGSARVDKWIANSNHVSRRIKKYYHQNSVVIYPPVDTESFAHNDKNKGNYYVTMSAHTPYKRLDLAIEAFNQRGDTLIILGEGPERSRLEKLAKPNIEFKGYISEHEREKILGSAKALIFPSEEDFGIAMVEALAAGTPVVAYNKGGAQEIVTNGKTGILFDKQTTQALNKAIDSLAEINTSSSELRASAKSFDKKIFSEKIRTFVNEAIK